MVIFYMYTQKHTHTHKCRTPEEKETFTNRHALVCLEQCMSGAAEQRASERLLSQWGKGEPISSYFASSPHPLLPLSLSAHPQKNLFLIVENILGIREKKI